MYCGAMLCGDSTLDTLRLTWLATLGCQYSSIVYPLIEEMTEFMHLLHLCPLWLLLQTPSSQTLHDLPQLTVEDIAESTRLAQVCGLILAGFCFVREGTQPRVEFSGRAGGSLSTTAVNVIKGLHAL